MILASSQVADLQYFLMDAAKRYVVASGAPAAEAEELLASAAALDYALLVASEYQGGEIDDDSATASSVRETMTRAAAAAFDVVARMLRAPSDAFEDFMERHVRAGGLFEVVRTLRDTRVVTAPDIAFRAVTLTSDLLERRNAG
jgi:hypothetical protein